MARRGFPRVVWVLDEVVAARQRHEDRELQGEEGEEVAPPMTFSQSSSPM